MKAETRYLYGTHAIVPRIGTHAKIPFKSTIIEDHIFFYAYDKWADILYLDANPMPLYHNDFFKQGWDLC